jgi:hypothetical protein
MLYVIPTPYTLPPIPCDRQNNLILYVYSTQSIDRNYMARQLKSWESPRKEGRNDKGKGGSARQRQLKKRMQMLRQKLKDQSKDDNNGNGRDKKGGNLDSLLFFVTICDRYDTIDYLLKGLRLVVNLTASILDIVTVLFSVPKGCPERAIGFMIVFA